MRTINRRTFLSRAATVTGVAALAGLPSRRVHAEEEWLITPPGWDATWAQARAFAASAPAAVTILGDSIASGVGTSDIVYRAWPGLLAAAVRERGLFGGDYWNATMSNEYVAANGGVPLTEDVWPGETPPFTQSHDGLTFPRWGLGRLPRFTAPGTVTLRSLYPIRGGDVVYFDDVAGGFTIQVAGGPVQSITTTGAGVMRAVRIEGIEPATAPGTRGAPAGAAEPRTHEVVFTTGSVPESMLIQGAWTYEQPARGIRIGRVAYGGATLGDYTRGDGKPADQAILWSGKTEGRISLGHPTQPHLAIIALGINDAQGVVSPETLAFFGDGLRRLVAAFRLGTPNASIMIIANNNPIGGPIEFRNAASWPRWREQMRTVAAEVNAAYLDIDARWRNLGIVQPPHPNDEGDADIASVIVPLLLPEAPIRE